MKKLSLLVGTLGGALAGYLFSKPELREELSNAKDAEKVGKILAKHFKHDGKKIGKEVKDFVQSDEVQKNLKNAQTYVKQQFDTAKKQVQTYVKQGTKAAKKGVKKAKTGFKQEKVK